MKVLVTGGTGFVGREVVRQLTAAAHEVWLWTRAGTVVDSGRPPQSGPQVSTDTVMVIAPRRHSPS